MLNKFVTMLVLLFANLKLLYTIVKMEHSISFG